MSASNVKWVRLGDYIERSMKNNSDLKYGKELIEGVNSDGVFCKSKANTDDVDLKPYKIVNKGDFVYNPSRLNIGSIAYRKGEMCIVSHLYVVFRLNETGRKCIEPEFLYLYLYRKEFFRQVTYLNFGSQRPEFNFFELSDIQIPLPDITIQKELVAAYNGLKRLAEENEALIEPLQNACQAYVADCMAKYPMKKIGNQIETFDKRNEEGFDYPFMGINKDKTFMPSFADTSDLDRHKYKVISKGEFVFSGMQTGRDICIRIGLYNQDTPSLLSPAYTTFSVTNKDLIPEYLFIQFNRYEMDRYGAFLSDGSIRSNLDWDRFCDIRIPVPPVDVQKAAVDIYNCLEEAKRISSEAREQLKTLCPALVQRASKA